MTVVGHVPFFLKAAASPHGPPHTVLFRNRTPTASAIQTPPATCLLPVISALNRQEHSPPVAADVFFILSQVFGLLEEEGTLQVLRIIRTAKENAGYEWSLIR